MKTIIISLGVILVISLNALGQIDERIPPKAEAREVQILAADFFNRFRKTPDLSLLINRFFVKDFSVRLKYCGTTGDCGGFGRDYWQQNNELLSLRGTERDYKRLYVASINYFFLYYRSIAHLASLSGQEVTEYEETGQKAVDERLEKKLRGRPAALVRLFANPDEAPPTAKSLAEFRKRLALWESYNRTLRSIERNIRSDLLKKRPKTRLSFNPSEFRVYREPNREGFFRYPTTLQMYDVWGDGDYLFLKMDLIREDGKLKIVAVYPPID